MNVGDCRFAIEVRRGDGSLVGSADASVTHCVEDALLHGVQSGHLANDGRVPPLRLVPRWNETQRPAVTGLSLRLGDALARHYATTVFDVQARALVARLLDEGRLVEGDHVQWQVMAREGAHEPPATTTRTSRAPFPLEQASLPGAQRGSFGVRFEVSVLRRLDARVRASATEEGAELLLGRVLHDRERQALELRVVDVLPLRAGRGGTSSRHFSFDPTTFLAARRLAASRSDGARAIGWHHNHPACGSCLDHPECEVDWVFFSAADALVHASAFWSPLMVALVSGKVGHLPARRPGFRLYGWNGGRVVPRSFHVGGEGSEAWSASDESFVPEEDA